ncbi:MAG: glycosyltransferase family 2 protein [Oscillospiraceae bacterium]|nr:glycosyltransferase family 2 protein [Oscillospiraceae bacterium]
MMEKNLISIVIPCYNEEESIHLFLDEITKVASTMQSVDFEYLFVDDGSADKTLEILKNLEKTDDRVRYISFSRNFGKEAALFAGLEAATGDYVAVMDVDLQDPPGLLPEMYETLTEGDYDCVATRRVNRLGEPRIRSFFARGFYRLINKISETQMVDGARDFRLMKRQMVDAVLTLREYNRFSKGLFNWVGFSTKWIAYENKPRIAGTTKWSFWGLLMYSLEGITAFSVRPLAISSVFGMLFCALSFISIIFLIIRWLIFGDPVDGWASTVTIILFVGGIQLFCTGILGQYMAKSYLEGKRRPVYIIKDSSDKKD